MEERINKPHYATRKPQNLIPLTDVKSVILFSKMVSLPSQNKIANGNLLNVKVLCQHVNVILALYIIQMFHLLVTTSIFMELE